MEGQLSLEALWKESGGDVNPTTFREFVRLGSRIDKGEKKSRTARAVLVSLALLGEPVTPLQLLGGAMILAFTLANEIQPRRAAGG